jgi:hypothetical protein
MWGVDPDGNCCHEPSFNSAWISDNDNLYPFFAFLNFLIVRRLLLRVKREKVMHNKLFALDKTPGFALWLFMNINFRRAKIKYFSVATCHKKKLCRHVDKSVVACWTGSATIAICAGQHSCNSGTGSEARRRGAVMPCS